MPIYCPDCDGERGHLDPWNFWIECETCGGTGYVDDESDED